MGRKVISIAILGLMVGVKAEAVFISSQESAGIMPQMNPRTLVNLVLPGPIFLADQTTGIEPMIEMHLLEYLFGGGVKKSDLRGTEMEIYTWELSRWEDYAQILLNQGKKPEEIGGEFVRMLRRRRELKPMIQAYHYLVIPERIQLRDWINFSDTMERMVSMLKGEFSFLPEGARLEEIAYKATTPIGIRRGTEWELATYKCLKTFTGHHGGAVTSVAYCKEPEQLLTGSRDGSIRRWNRLEGKALLRWCPHNGAVTHLAVSPDGRWVLSYASRHLA
ncbi:MAG: WD40 repeat domain-containing protein, partial [Candidatus Omnitrophota bacterium]